jgi:hypothetical protein
VKDKGIWDGGGVYLPFDLGCDGHFNVSGKDGDEYVNARAGVRVSCLDEYVDARVGVRVSCLDEYECL